MKTKKVILGVVIFAILLSIYYLEKSKVTPSSVELTSTPSSPLVTSSSSPSSVKEGKYSLAPELAGISGYINTKEGIKIADFRGKVVLIDFWTYTCINCIRTLPHLTAWDTKYRNKGLVIIGVHTPEFEFEKKKENVEAAIQKYGIGYAVVQDNEYATWRAFRNRYWPHKYLIDKEGYIRYDHIGEGAYDETEQKIQELLMEIDPNVVDMPLTGLEDRTPHQRTTPELYAGYEFALPRGQNIGNEEGLRAEEIVAYEFPEEREKDKIYLQGSWRSNGDNVEAMSDSTALFLDFTAASVNIVADSLDDTPLLVEVLVDGQHVSETQAGTDVQFEREKAFIMVKEPRLYNVIDGEYGRHRLELKTKKGFTVNAFTFG